MGIMVCPICRTRVLPKSDGTCPSCRSVIAEAEEPPILKASESSPATSPEVHSKTGTKYGEIVSQAWQLTWRNKYLWIFGFFAALNFGGANIGATLTQGGAWLFQSIGILLTTRGLLSVLFFVISILFWLIGTNARVAIVYEIAAINGQAHDAASKTRDLFLVSTRFLISIILMQLLVWMPITILNIGSAFVTAPSLESWTASIEAGRAPDLGSFGLVWLVSCGIGLLTIPLSVIDAVSYRSIVISDLGVTSGVKKAFQVMRGNIGTILILCIIVTVIGFIFSVAIGAAMSPLLLLLLRSMAQLTAQCTPATGDIRAMMDCMRRINTDPSVIAPFLAMSVIFAALTSIPVVFQSAIFTVAYSKLKGAK